MTLKFDLISDLHEDHYKSEPTDWAAMKNEGSEILVIAGDLSHYTSTLYDALDKAKDHYKHVVFVTGNHEMYATNEEVTKFEKKLQKEINKRFNNVTLLNGKNVFKIGNTAFIGANGWYNWRALEPLFTYDQCQRAWKRGMNDYRYIKFDDNNQEYGPDVLAEKHMKLLKAQVKKLQSDDSVDNIVVVTHTIPRKELLVIKNDYSWDSLSPSFCNSQMVKILEADVKKKIRCFMYGHTHDRRERVIDGINYVINAKGYPRELGEYLFRQVEIK